MGRGGGVSGGTLNIQTCLLLTFSSRGAEYYGFRCPHQPETSARASTAGGTATSVCRLRCWRPRLFGTCTHQEAKSKARGFIDATRMPRSPPLTQQRCQEKTVAASAVLTFPACCTASNCRIPSALPLHNHCPCLGGSFVPLRL